MELKADGGIAAGTYKGDHQVVIEVPWTVCHKKVEFAGVEVLPDQAFEFENKPVVEYFEQPDRSLAEL